MTATKKSKIAMVMSCIAAGLAAKVGLVGDAKTTKSVNAFEFTRGALDGGKVIESNEHLVTKNDYTVDGLSIDIDEDSAIISYKVAFYDADGEFISITEEKVEDFDSEDIPEDVEGAKTFKVVITPNQVDGEAVKLNAFNQYKYINQLKITYSRE